LYTLCILNCDDVSVNLLRVARCSTMQSTVLQCGL